jgi:uncharacterized damage-inducible protein DinB
MKESLKKILEDWKQIRQLTLDLLDELPEEHLEFTIGKNMGTFGKQFRHIGDVQFCYAEAIKTGKINFDKYKRDYSLETSKKELQLFLQEVDAEMLNSINLNQEVIIDWFGVKWNMEQHLKALIEHEILHHGELIVYMRTLELEFPKSWKLWGV